MEKKKYESDLYSGSVLYLWVGKEIFTNCDGQIDVFREMTKEYREERNS